jgi:hypothetical protein
MQTVIETEACLRAAKDAGMSAEDMTLQSTLSRAIRRRAM